MFTNMNSKKIIFKIIYLQVCFLFFMDADFSNAAQTKIDNPVDSFQYSILLSGLFVKLPDQEDFIQQQSTHSIFLCIHKNDYHEVSIYEQDAPETIVTFRRSSIIVKVFLLETILFSAEIDDNIWHFQCLFNTDQRMMDWLYSYLRLFTTEEATKPMMGIERVVSYIKPDLESDPHIENINELQPAKLYGVLLKKNCYKKKLFEITTSATNENEDDTPRLAFCTGSFKMATSNNKVVLAFHDLPGFFIILYFEDPGHAATFAGYIMICKHYATRKTKLETPPHLQLYLDST